MDREKKLGIERFASVEEYLAELQRNRVMENREFLVPMRPIKIGVKNDSFVLFGTNLVTTLFFMPFYAGYLRVIPEMKNGERVEFRKYRDGFLWEMPKIRKELRMMADSIKTEEERDFLVSAHLTGVSLFSQTIGYFLHGYLEKDAQAEERLVRF